MNQKFLELREKYSNFIYHNYSITKDENSLSLEFDFEIEGLTTFKPKIEIDNKYITNGNIDSNTLNNLVFNIGMIEALSYLKATCSKNVIIKAGYLDEEQIKWWRKLYYYGLGEFLYRNDIDVSENELFNFIIEHSYENFELVKCELDGNLICIGGGKDSNVVLELLKGKNNVPIVMNPKSVHLECINIAGYDNPFIIKRTLDSNILKLNEEGYLNGHTPFSALVAFVTYLCAYLSNKKNIVLSNESSANEPTVLDSKINHQYSKSYEFENDFKWYSDNYLKLDINYFSMLRCLNETQISLLFSKYKKFHKAFKSCNVGSKNKEWNWCLKCPKCLFVYVILSQYLNDDELYDIFGSNLLNDDSLLTIFKELTGYSKTKPFECVGTYEEVRDAVSKSIKLRKDNLPYLLQYYLDNYDLEEYDFLHEFNEENNIPDDFIKIVKEELDKYV